MKKTGKDNKILTAPADTMQGKVHSTAGRQNTTSISCILLDSSASVEYPDWLKKELHK